MSLKASRRVLLVGGEGVVLYNVTGRTVERETALAWDVPGFDQQLVDALLSQNRNKSVLVLFDGADQTYRKEENIPKLSPIDRPRFVKRKLELAFPSYPIRASLAIKPPKVKGARQDQPSYLFVALPETDQLDRVGGCLYEAGVPVAGFGLLPAESASLVTVLTEKVFAQDGKYSRWQVLIGQHETGGLRQVVVKDGNLALTRLTPTSEAGTNGAGWAEEVAREFRATLTYITRFGYIPEDGLSVIVVCGDIEKQFFNPQAMEIRHFKCLSAGEALHHMGVRLVAQAKSNFAEMVHAAWAGRKTSLRLPMRVPSIHRIQAPRLAARIGSILLVLTGIGLAYLTADAYAAYGTLQDELELKQNRKTMLDREYEQESKVFEALPVKPAIVKAAMAVKKRLEENSLNISPLLHRMKDVLGTDLRLESLKIEHTPGPALNLSGQPRTGYFFADPNDKGKVKVNFRFGLPDSVPLEQKILRAEDLQKRLKAAFPDYSVSIVSQFGNVDRRSGKMSADIGEDGEKTASTTADLAEFSLEGAPLP